MGHDAHFLSRLARVSDADVELAMSLYRDVPLVRSVVEAAPMPEDVTRVAIALDASDAPPLVLVDRSGRFVTCLAPGMKTDLPIISRAALDRALREKQKIGVIRGAAERFDAVRSKRAFVYDECERVDLEMMEILLVTAPVCLQRGFADLGKYSRRVATTLATLARRERLRPRDKPLLEQAWREGWVGAHYLLVVATGLRASTSEADSLNHFLACQRTITAGYVVPWTLRAVWAGAHVGKPVLPLLKESLSRDDQWSFLTALTLGAMALGHRKLEGEIRKLLERHTDKLGCSEVLLVLDQPERYAEVVRSVAGSTGVLMTQHLPNNDPARYHTEEEVPADCALALLGQAPLSRVHEVTRATLLGALPLLARAGAQDFYAPHSVMSRWNVFDSVDVMRRLVQEEIPHASRRQVRAPEAPGRNDPCQCGSGRKYKKCCAA